MVRSELSSPTGNSIQDGLLFQDMKYLSKDYNNLNPKPGIRNSNGIQSAKPDVKEPGTKSQETNKLQMVRALP